MKTPSLGQLGLSLVGVYALVHALVLFPSLATWGSVLLERDQAAIAVSVTLVPFGLLVVLGVLLVAHPESVARWIWRGKDRTETLPVTDELASLLLAICGILVVTAAFPDLLSVSLQSLSTGAPEGLRLRWLAGQLARAFLGMFLFLRPGVVLDFWRRKQPGDRASEAQPPDADAP